MPQASQNLMPLLVLYKLRAGRWQYPEGKMISSARGESFSVTRLNDFILGEIQHCTLLELSCKMNTIIWSQILFPTKCVKGIFPFFRPYLCVQALALYMIAQCCLHSESYSCSGLSSHQRCISIRVKLRAQDDKMSALSVSVLYTSCTLTKSKKYDRDDASFIYCMYMYREKLFSYLIHIYQLVSSCIYIPFYSVWK